MAAAEEAPLARRQTLACKKDGGDVVLLDQDTITRLKAQLCPTWQVSEDGKSLTRSFVCKNFRTALNAINAYGELAEENSHHPDLHLTSYRNVTIRFYTHAIGGISINDFIMAAKTDEVPVEYSPKFVRETPDLRAGRSGE